MTELIGYFDGECRGNEQKTDPTKREMRIAHVIGERQVVHSALHPQPSNNNVAEYIALIQLLEHILKYRPQFQGLPVTKYIIIGDSQLVIRQMCGEYKVKNSVLLPLFDHARGLVVFLVLRGLDIEFRWVPREQNPAGRLLE